MNFCILQNHVLRHEMYCKKKKYFSGITNFAWLNVALFSYFQDQKSMKLIYYVISTFYVS
eukprot:TRINITY_DN3332_c1_g7_i1.p1 TRINITY_DN3332_c1_g7~~TRINITY_DN3332_c1_g7_i1.p1  ORF type:complete len:60 (-),score=0.95 TRINITY_DN3332_c1_g7_i1:25-204(-)